MSQNQPNADYELIYWPLPFRGCFVSYLFAYRDVPLIEISDFDEINSQKDRPCKDQAIPFMGPPTLRHRTSGFTLSQMPAIVLHVAPELDLLPERHADLSMGLKVFMDCNDILMELCRYNGSTMWERDEWLVFRLQRFPRWLEILEECCKRGLFGAQASSFVDIAVYALLGNMTRCLPELEGDVVDNAPLTFQLCRKIGAEPSLASYVEGQAARYGQLYCGGYIEASIRDMLALDAG
ncbi:MAG: glutathione S-transferase family protein [Pseudomonadota bacterium]